ncbi:hypothetical protein D3C73_1025820 [compost metagenome]
MGQRVCHVEERPDPANPEIGDGQAFAWPGLATHQPEPSSQRADQQEERQSDQHLRPTDPLQETTGYGAAKEHQNHHGHQTFELLYIAMQHLVIGVVVLGGPDSQSAKEDRDEPVALHHFRSAVGQESSCERHETLGVF